ncbi:zinc finger containing protein [Holotrichia oblita]|uniref:Zinc finger containing protein n=1 Tax=Holotrichia oblita TaxID=644536 RepID=A0ACB9TBB8_HOLOL|nr:zinc finger containing protein [Holotrichia oblita]
MPMATYSSFTQNSTSREDSRISRSTGSTNKCSPTSAATESSWQSQQNRHYSQPLQTSYQHLQGSMYSDPSQYSSQTYQYSGYPNYTSTTYSGSKATDNRKAAAICRAGYNVKERLKALQPRPPGDDYPQGNWAPVDRYDKSGSQNSKPDGVAQEMKHQKAELMKQREEYERRVSVLRRELDLLRRQKHELLQNHSSDRDRDHILRENSKLQVEIQNKLKDAFNVIEILSGIIGDTSKMSEGEESPKRARSRSVDVKDVKFNYIHYDPELHWCRMCDVFPKTAKDLLIHLHTKEHRDMMQDDEIPWHKLPAEPEFPYVEGASKKRLPIKGLQFFVSATAWYCRLCDVWVGDLHCASSHLRSIKHSQNYTNFVEQNPHWELEWLKDRERALERVKRGNRSSDSEENREKKKKKRKDKYSPSNSSAKDKKKKKRSKKKRKDSSDSSSSSSSSASSSEEEEDDKKDPSKSIHVAMRNKMKLQAQMIMNEELTGKWEAIGRLVEERKKKESATHEVKEVETEDHLINQWMTVKQPQDKDKALLENLKDRLKQKQEAEKVRQAELERKRKEREREEQERKEREEKQARELEEAKRKEREEMERLKDIREQIKFKTKEKYRRRRSHSHSPERKHSRSPNYDHRRKTPEKYRRHNDDHSPRNKRKYDREDSKSDRKPPPPPSYKKLPFIGRMPLFKNKKPDERPEKEIKKEDYDIPRQTRFQPGNLARAFIPEPEVVCFPKLSSYPEIIAPPPPAPKIVVAEPPAPPKITETVPKAPPPPKINNDDKKVKKTIEEEVEREERDKDKKEMEISSDDLIMLDDNPLNDYHEPFEFDNSYVYGSTVDYNMMYPPHPPMFDFTQDVNVDNGGKSGHSVPLSHTMPLQPPPLPPDDPNDDLAMLGISSDDLAAQTVK